MNGNRINRRRIFAVALTSLLAACQVIPKSTDTAPSPPVVPDEGIPDDGGHRVALLVPMTGQNAGAGTSIANATTMAVLDTNTSKLRITTYDTGSGAANAAARAVSDGNRLILGPLLSDNISAVSKVAAGKSVPLISYSNDAQKAARDVFVMGQIPGQSISRTVGYAIGKGHTRFAALLPSGDYGDRARAALAIAARDGGASVVAEEGYDRSAKGIIAAARRLIAKGGFDAVLIADGPRLSELAASQFADSANRPRILGTELWSGESSVAAAASLRGAWFSAVSDGRFAQFVKSYKARFGKQPYRIATLGYDSVLLTLRVARDWQPGRAFP
ncbi:MAG: penicillin-binding protein activator, partial [Novosphingobium sp.]